MRIGYVCHTYLVDFHYKTLHAKTLSKETFLSIVKHNLEVLQKQMEYNVEHDISFQRITSELIPFASSSLCPIDWKLEFAETLQSIGAFILQHRIRVSMHPGQYTILNSPVDKVTKQSIAELQYHADLLDCLGLDSTHKIVLHLGGMYGDKTTAIQRFCRRYARLPQNVKRRLVLENDDLHYSLEDVMFVHQKVKIPIVFDNLHHQICPSYTDLSLVEVLQMVHHTWKQEDGVPKIHYSEQARMKRIGVHARTIHAEPFTALIKQLQKTNLDFDVMIEVKDKNLSVLKAKDLLSPCKMAALETTWSKYKYEVLAREPNIYQAIRELLQDKSQCPIFPFYILLENALESVMTKGHFNNAFSHMMGYLSNQATTMEKMKCNQIIEAPGDHPEQLRKALTWLHRLSEKYQAKYLLQQTIFLNL